MTNTNPLARSTPESQGISSSDILSFLKNTNRDIHDLHSFMLLVHGNVVAEGWWKPYQRQAPHMLFSLSKSFTSTAVGLAIAEKRFRLDDTVASFFPDDLPSNPGENLLRMRIRDLLTMNTGQESEPKAMGDRSTQNWVQNFLAWPVPRTPGTHFVYNSMATYMCSAILQKVTGVTLLEYLQDRLLQPLGIENATWEQCPRGISVGGWGLKIRTQDIAHFGQLYLQRGQWQGRQLVPAQWVDQATARQVPCYGADGTLDWVQGYGYQFWRCQHDAYRGDGAFGQYCIVLPRQSVVVAITAGVSNMQTVLDRVWEDLLPALQAAPLKEDPAAAATLERELSSLTLPTALGKTSSPLAAALSGKTWEFDPNDQHIESIQLNFDSDQTRLTIRDNRGSHSIALGHNTWLDGTTAFDSPAGPRPLAASCAWTDDHTLIARLYYTQTPFSPTLTFRLADGKLAYQYHVNLVFGQGESDRKLLLSR